MRFDSVMTSNNNITRDKPSLFPSSFFPSIPCVDALILILTPPNRKPVYLLPFDCNKLVVALFSVFDSYVDVLVLFIILSTLILFHNNNCLVDLIIHYFCPLNIAVVFAYQWQQHSSDIKTARSCCCCSC